MADEPLELGGNISLAGFRDLDSATMTVLKKMVGTYTKKFSEGLPDFEGLKLHLKDIHKREKGEIYELHAHLYRTGQSFDAEAEDRNLFVAIDTALKKVEKMME